MQRFAELAERTLDCRSNEYREIAIGGASFTPSEAARRVHDGRLVSNYIPSPVEAGAPLPLSESEIAELYRTNGSVPAADEAELRGVLPDPMGLPSAQEFAAIVEERAELTTQDLNPHADIWEAPPKSGQLAILEHLSEKLRGTATEIERSEQWQLATMLAGQYGESHRKPWQALLAQIDETWTAASAVQDSLIQYDPRLPDDISLEEAYAVSMVISARVARSGKLSFLTLFPRKTWKRFIRASRVGNIEPVSPEHFAALHGLADIALRRQQLVLRWRNQMFPLGAPAPESLGPAPEQACRQFSGGIRRRLDWYSKEWEPLEAEMTGVGLRFRQLLEEQPSDASGGELSRLAKFLGGPMQNVLAARCNAIRWKNSEDKIRGINTALEQPDGGGESTLVVERLRRAVRLFDPSAYRSATERLDDLIARRGDLELRRALLKKLEPVAAGWTAAIRTRVGIHGEDKSPDAVRDAWLWRQLSDELDRRGQVSLRDLQDKSDRCARELQDCHG